MNKISKFQMKTASELLISPLPRAPVTRLGPAGTTCEDGKLVTQCLLARGGHVASGEPHAAVRAAAMGADVLSSESSHTYPSAQKQTRK